jgi:hypothetical protein
MFGKLQGQIAKKQIAEDFKALNKEELKKVEKEIIFENVILQLKSDLIEDTYKETTGGKE